jgi:exonuclease III
MNSRVHRSLKIIAFNSNGIERQRHELNKLLQDLCIDVALFSETYLKPHERFFITNYHVYRMDQYPSRKGGTAVAVRKGIPHNHVELPPPPCFCRSDRGLYTRWKRRSTTCSCL